MVKMIMAGGITDIRIKTKSKSIFGIWRCSGSLD